MINQRIGKIKVRRGTESQRITNFFEEGEVIYSVDKKRIFVGDNVTLGGVPVSNHNYIVETLGNPPTIPPDVLAGDIIFDKSEEKTYITNWNGTEYELLLIADADCCQRLKNQIDDLYTKLRTMTGCLAPPPPPPPPPSRLTWVIQPINNSVNIGDTVTFTASAVGDNNISYVWRRTDGLTINTTNIYNRTITITNVNIPDIATYYCIASNTVDSITSVNVDLNVDTNSILAEDGTRIMSEINEFILWEEKIVGLTITKQPVSVSTTAGTSVTFSVEAMGSPPITYQWRIGGVDVVGETNPTYTITNPTVDINSISCKVSNPAGDVISNSVNLTIIKITAFIKNIDGYYHSLAVGIDGTLSAWGLNISGQLGDGTRTNRLTPVKINLPPVSMVAAGNSHSLAVGIDGTLSAWGYNLTGQLGDGTTTNRLTPIKINLPPVSMVACGHANSLAVGIDGTLSAWGLNISGQLGDGTRTNRLTPIKINLPPVSMISVGREHTLAVGIDGTLSAWGNNPHGQIGDGTLRTERLTPIKINLPPVSMVAAGENHSLALGIDGTLSAWGFGGQLGDGTTTNRLTPIKINLPPVSMISVGRDHSLALGIDGTLSAWGKNIFGELGDGTLRTERLTPIKINLPPVSMVACGVQYSLAVGIDGTLSAWGRNDDGRLGDGTTTDRLTPIKII